METLDKEQVLALISDLNDWKIGYPPREYQLPECIFTSVNCPVFAVAMKLANQVADAVQGGEDHFGLNIDHLGVSVYGFPGYTRVTFMLRTYNKVREKPPFGVTEQDIALARMIQAVLTQETHLLPDP